MSKPPSRSQMLFSLFYSMIPLIAFWLVEKYYGIEAGIIAAVVLSILEVAWVYAREKRWEPFAIGSAVLIIVMGGISWMTGDNTFVKLKPAIIEGIFAGMFIVSSIIKKPFMLAMAKKQLGGEHLNDFSIEYFHGLNWRIGILFLVHTIMTVYAAIWMSSDAWAFTKGVLFYVLFAIFFVVEFVYSRWFFRKKMQYQMKQLEFLEMQRNLMQNIKTKNNPKTKK